MAISAVALAEFSLVFFYESTAPEISGTTNAQAIARPGPSNDAHRGARSGGRAVIWAVGDGADGSDEAKEVADMIAADDPDRLLYLGDVYETGTDEEFDKHYDPIYGDMADITQPTIGNHEWRLHEDGYIQYWEAMTGREQRLFYSFELAGWEIISLNSEGGLAPKDEQLAFLEKELSEPGTCRLPFWHTARYSAVPDSDEPVVEPFWNALKGHTEIVLSAHEHTMQRFLPIHGITQLVSGAGGHELYGLDAADPRVAFADDENYGALRLELQPGLARYAFVASDGEVLDEGTIRCEPLGGSS